MNTKQALFVLNEPTAPRLAPQLAQEIGLNESILLLQIEFWIRISGKEVDGKQWVYESISDIQEVFPFWGRSTINRIIHSLEKKKLIHIDNHNKYKYDRTRWFALNPEGCSNLSSIVITDVLCHYGTRTTHNGTRETQNGTTIPDLSSDLSTEEDAPQDGDLPAELFPEQDPTPEPAIPADDHSVLDHTDPLSMMAHCAEKRKQNGDAPDWAMIGAEGVHRFYPVLLAFCTLTRQDPLLIRSKRGVRWLAKYGNLSREHDLTPADLLQAHEFLPDKDRGAWYIENHKWSTPYNNSYEEQLVLAAMQIKGGTITTKNGWSKAMS